MGSLSPAVTVDLLSGFKCLVYLAWYAAIDPDDGGEEDEEPVPHIIALPKLETLAVEGSGAAAALVDLQAPLLHTLHVHSIIASERDNDAQNAVLGWLEVSQPRFPLLRTLTLPILDAWEYYKAMDVLSGINELHEVELSCDLDRGGYEFAALLKAIGVAMLPSNYPKMFDKLYTIHIAYHGNFDPVLVLGLEHSLDALFKRQEALRPDMPKVRIGLPPEVVQASAELEEFVENHLLAFIASGPLEVPESWN